MTTIFILIYLPMTDYLNEVQSKYCYILLLECFTWGVFVRVMGYLNSKKLINFSILVYLLQMHVSVYRQIIIYSAERSQYLKA